MEDHMLPEFDLLMPKTLPEALEMLAEGVPDVTPLAGGTGLLVDMRGGLRRPRALVDLSGLDELRAVRRENGHVVAGAGVTIAELLEHALIAQHAPVLQQGAAVFANPLVRNRATLGGNLAYASPAADTAPPLLVLDAEDELLAAIRWPVPSPRAAGAFRKLALRKADAIAVVSAAVMVERDDDGRCVQARIALGAVAPTPIRARAAEDLLRGQPLTPDAIAEAAHLAAGATCCVDDVRASASYRQRVADTLVRRLLAEVA
jgi:CO/xanthine dehydrogenase FAD-binding subunit